MECTQRKHGESMYEEAEFIPKTAFQSIVYCENERHHGILVLADEFNVSMVDQRYPFFRECAAGVIDMACPGDGEVFILSTLDEFTSMTARIASYNFATKDVNKLVAKFKVSTGMSHDADSKSAICYHRERKCLYYGGAMSIVRVDLVDRDPTQTDTGSTCESTLLFRITPLRIGKSAGASLAVEGIALDTANNVLLVVVGNFVAGSELHCLRIESDGTLTLLFRAPLPTAGTKTFGGRLNVIYNVKLDCFFIKGSESGRYLRLKLLL